MTVRNDLSINWSASPRIITVAAPSTDITIQDLLDTLRSLESTLSAMDDDALVDGSGKESLGGGLYVGLTVTLQNAKLAFEARSGPSFDLCKVSGGNLVALDADGDTFDTPIHPTAYVQVVLAASTSAALLTASVEVDEEAIAAAIAAQSIAGFEDPTTLGGAINAIEGKTAELPTDTEAVLTAIGTKTSGLPANTATELTTIQTKTNNLPANTATELSTIQAKTNNLPADTATQIAGIRTKTDNLPVNTATELTGIKAKTDNLPANTATELTAIKAKTDNLPANTATELTSIKAKTDNLPANTAAELTAIKAKTDVLPNGVKRGVAFSFTVGLVADDLDVSAVLSKDHGAFANLSTAIVGIGNQGYRVSLTAAEANAIDLYLLLIADGMNPVPMTIRTSA